MQQVILNSTLFSDDGNNTHSFVSGSHDQTLMIWEWNEVTNDVTCAMVCKDHDGSVDCVSVNADQTLVSTTDQNAHIITCKLM